jgi:5-methylcytosine-specific restriction endonuclease McrA
MAQDKFNRLIKFVLLLGLSGHNIQAIEPILSSFNFQRLARSEVHLLKSYLHQIEHTSKRQIPPSQLKVIVNHYDQGIIYRRQAGDIIRARQNFQRRKIMVAADWSYYNQEKMPELFSSDASLPNDETVDAWDLHHVIFLRLNGQNEWWNIIPMPRKKHHLIIHGKDQPGETLHKMLEDRFQDTGA